MEAYLRCLDPGMRDEVLQVLRDKAADRFEVLPEQIGEDSSLADDLNADSLSLVELALDLEEALGIELSEQDLSGVTTVGGVVDALVAKQQG